MEVKDLRPKVFSTHPETDGAKGHWLHWIKTFTTYINKLGELSADDKLNLLINHVDATRRRRRLEMYSLQVRHKQDWGRGFILLLPQTVALPEPDAGSGVIKPASSFVIQNLQTSCSMWCPMYRARC